MFKKILYLLLTLAAVAAVVGYAPRSWLEHSGVSRPIQSPTVLQTTSTPAMNKRPPITRVVVVQPAKLKKPSASHFVGGGALVAPTATNLGITLLIG